MQWAVLAAATVFLGLPVAVAPAVLQPFATAAMAEARDADSTGPAPTLPAAALAPQDAARRAVKTRIPGAAPRGLVFSAPGLGIVFALDGPRVAAAAMAWDGSGDRPLARDPAYAMRVVGELARAGAGLDPADLPSAPRFLVTAGAAAATDAPSAGGFDGDEALVFARDTLAGSGVGVAPAFRVAGGTGSAGSASLFPGESGPGIAGLGAGPTLAAADHPLAPARVAEPGMLALVGLALGCSLLATPGRRPYWRPYWRPH